MEKVIDLELWRLEVDGRYFEDLAISIEENVATAIDVAIDLAEDTFGCAVRGFYLCPETNTISLYLGLWTSTRG